MLGTTYGGNGTTTFQLPDLRGRLAVGFGQGNGLSPYALGEAMGQESVAITVGQMPGSHTHTVTASTATAGGTNTPGPAVWLSSAATNTSPPTVVDIDSTDAPSVTMGKLAPTGGQTHENRMPFLAMNYCICVAGIFPSHD